MDRRTLSWILLLACSAGCIRGNPNLLRRQHTPSEYLAPPPIQFARAPLRPPGRTGRFHDPRVTTEAPGYLSRLMGWLNPFGSPNINNNHPTPPRPFPARYNPGLPPPTQKRLNCDPCNRVAWVPLPGFNNQPQWGVNPSDGSSGLHAPPAEEIRPSDFTYPPAAPIPHPHLYPGPLPPLYGPIPFVSGGEHPISSSPAELPPQPSNIVPEYLLPTNNEGASSGSVEPSVELPYAGGSIHIEQSPLLDLTKDSTTNRPWVDSINADSSIVSSAPVYHEDSYKSPSEQDTVTEASFKQENVVSQDPTEDEPFLEALMRSYNNFKKEIATETVPVDVYSNQNGERNSKFWSLSTQTPFVDESNKEPEIKGKKKQVRVIIPYTLQYAPSPFHTLEKSVDNNGNVERARKVPGNFRIDVHPTSNSIESTGHPIDVHRLQKNIDNWTIQEYSRSPISSTVKPSSSRPYLLPSKKIPDEYLTTTEPSESATTSHDLLADFDEETASSEVKDIQEKNGTQAASSQQVYVVTPLTNNIDDESLEQPVNDFEAIEKAYEVLPQAVNDLAVASTGPQNMPLWGIMEHEEYITSNSTSTTQSAPILYAGHSKVSRAR